MANNIEKILIALAREYAGVKPALTYKNPFQLLIAVILSAQCTDVRVNQVTARLFSKYPEPVDYCGVTQEQLEDDIRECGLFRNKAKNIRATCWKLVHQHGSQVPSERGELEALPGVGRKSANVVLSQAFGQPAMAVDTHVFRVSHRLGLAKGSTPLATEKELCQAIPQELWSEAHLWLIYHGRRVCKAPTPLCGECFLWEWCPEGQGRLPRG